jgi:tRNA(Arg) A34 adenosine deaminase TadA
MLWSTAAHRHPVSGRGTRASRRAPTGAVLVGWAARLVPRVVSKARAPSSVEFVAYQPVARDSLSAHDLRHLRRCLELAEEALAAGDEPFGSVLVTAEGIVRAEDRNRTADGDQTRHPEFALARWAAQHLDVAERAGATVYTSGEHCPMCSAAHAWVGLGRIAYVASSEQLVGWLRELGVDPAPVRPLPVQEVAPAVAVAGPAPELAEQIRALHRKFQQGRTKAP